MTGSLSSESSIPSVRWVGRKARQAGHGAATRHQRGADFPLRQERLLAAGEAHVARQGQLAADAGGAAADRHDDTTGARLRRTSMSGNAGRPVAPGEMPVVAESGGTKS